MVGTRHRGGARTVTVVVADGDRRRADRLASLLDAAPGTAVLGRAADAGGAREAVVAQRPAVVLVAWRLPGGGAALVADLCRPDPHPEVVVVAAHLGPGELAEALDAGCSGLITPEGPPAEIVGVVRGAAAGAALAPLSLLRPSVPGPPAGPGAPAGTGLASLSARELQVLNLLSEGRSTRDIAGELFLSVNTVRNHVQSMLAKLGVHSRLEAVAAARGGGGADPGGGEPRPG